MQPEGPKPGEKKGRSVLDALREDYESGRFASIRESLETFIRNNRLKIVGDAEDLERQLRFCDLSGRDTFLELAVKKNILDTRILNPAIDAREQIEEIRRHIWLEGVRLNRPPDVEATAQEWLKKYGKNWREYRLLAALYVFEREQDRFLDILKGEGGNDGDA